MSSLTDCYKCNSKFYIDDYNKCSSCIDEHCLSCSFEGKMCSKCEDGYYLAEAKYTNGSVSDGICVSCSDYKKYTGEGVCEYSVGWRKFAFECGEFSVGCIESDPTPIIGIESEDCRKCGDGYKLDDKNISCIQCPAKCLNCSWEHDCDECVVGYYLND